MAVTAASYSVAWCCGLESQAVELPQAAELAVGRGQKWTSRCKATPEQHWCAVQQPWYCTHKIKYRAEWTQMTPQCQQPMHKSPNFSGKTAVHMASACPALFTAADLVHYTCN